MELSYCIKKVYKKDGNLYAFSRKIIFRAHRAPQCCFQSISVQNAINFHIFLYCEMRSEIVLIFCCQRFISCMRSFECCSFPVKLRTLYFSQGLLFYTGSQVHCHVVHIVCLLIRSYELQFFRSLSALAFCLSICSIVLHCTLRPFHYLQQFS